MPITTHVTNLELSRRLKELNVPQKSLFRWDEGDGVEDRLEYLPEFSNKTHELTSAYLASELGEMLKTSDYYLPYTSEDWSIWECRVGNTPDGEKQYLQAATECNCRAKMLIHLLENHLISVEELGN